MILHNLILISQNINKLQAKTNQLNLNVNNITGTYQ